MLCDFWFAREILWFAKRRDRWERRAHVPSSLPYSRILKSFSLVVGRDFHILKCLGISHAYCQIVHVANHWEGPMPGARFRSKISVTKIVTRIVMRIVTKKPSKTSVKKFMWWEVETCLKIKIASHYNSHYNFRYNFFASETGPKDFIRFG